MSTDLLDLIRAEAAASPVVEVCGLLLGTPDPPNPVAPSVATGGLRMERLRPVLGQAQQERGSADVTITQVRACRNVAADPTRRFEIDPAALLAAHRQARAGGPAILGCYHSHPSGRAEPSTCDAAAAEPNGWLWLIVAGDEVRGWRAVEGGARFGRFDEVGGRG